METMFGRFEILGELSRSETGVIYKATDKESNQTVALKVVSLGPLGERASTFVDALIAEGESTKDLSSQNIALLYGAGEIESQFCAAMEYIQGNSVATMLARKEGFSIWDLLDITRQVCAALDCAASVGVVHYSLEPAKVMVQWDGLAKILGYGISNMSLIGAEAGAGLGPLLPYCSPEQVRGERIDLRSNIFTWGAVLYEMVTDRKAFDAADQAALVNQIQNEMPPRPSALNPKIQPAVSALILKALAKNPEERYQAACDLVADLEKCKESGSRQPNEQKKSSSVARPAVSAQARAAAASKFISSPAEATPAAPTPSPEPAPRKAAAAAAGVGAADSSMWAPSQPDASSFRPELEASLESSGSPVMSSAAAEPETKPVPGYADPMMSGAAPGSTSTRSFSEIDELPPLKEPVFEPAPPPPPIPEIPEPSPLVEAHRTPSKPKVQPREVAEKAINEIKTVPPRLLIYSILAAVGVILVVSLALFFHVRSEDDQSTAAPRPVVTRPAAPAPVAAPDAAATQTTPAPVPAAEAAPPAEEAQPEVTVRNFGKRNVNSFRRKSSGPVAAAAVPGQVQIDSSPQGAQIQVDGNSNPAWITPFSLAGLPPGQHSISVSKSGYSSDTRSVDVAWGSKSFVVFHLAPISALIVVGSTPPGASVILDGKNTGRVTPAQFQVDKGGHTVVLRKQGYLDESTTADLAAGQNFQFAPTLRILGNAEDIRNVGTFKRIFGGGGDSVAGMGTVSIRTEPKGAQIAINRRLLDKLSPTEFMVGPGNYIVDITLTGFKPVHKIVTVEKNGKVAVDEILERQ